jgi:flagellar basal-body rod protein FlgF
MDNALYVGLSRQMTLRRQLDIVANNIANVDTAGFKMESLMVGEEPARPASTMQAPNPVKFVLDKGVARDFGQGGLSQTGNKLDFAIEGQAFFQVMTPDGERYTRDGRFTRNAQGQLATSMGHPVLDEGGSEITLDPRLGEVSVTDTGSVSQGGQRVGKIGLARFDDLSQLEKAGDNYFRNVSNLTAQDAPDARVRQGMVESSNVKPIIEVTKLIEVSRAYEQMAKIMDSTAELSRRSIERMGRVQ